MGSRNRRGFALVYVMVIMGVLFTLSFVLIQTMRHESSQSFRHLEKTIAVFAAECGIEHGIYILQYHRNSDMPYFSAAGGSGQVLEINKKFATQDEFTMELPTNAPDDARFAELKDIDMNTKLQEIATANNMDFVPTIDKIEIEYKTLKTVESSADRLLKYGLLTLRSTATYATTTITVESIRRLEVYRTLSIEPDWQFAVIGDTKSEIPARRKYGAAITGGSIFTSQYLIVQNGRDAAGGAVPSKIYGKNLEVCLNNYQSNINILPTSQILQMLNASSDTIAKLGSDTYNGNYIDPKHDDNTDSPLIEFQPYRTALGDFEGIDGYLSEWDATDGGLVGAFVGFINPFPTGGSRGSIDFTGLPVESTSIPGILIDFMSSLFGNQTEFKLNSINGDIRRKYGYVEKSDGIIKWAIEALTGADTTIVDDEPYIFAIGTDEPANPKPYDAEVYKKLASHGNGRLFDKPKDFESHRLAAGKLLFWDDIGGKDYNNMVWLWGWAESYKDQPADSLWKFWKWGTRNAFEATRLNAEHALQVNGSYFVDGNVFIEGYYRGRGAVVATGNIIIGGSLMRHPDDGLVSAEAVDWHSDGPNNMLQLIALGTRPAEGGKPTGKIIFAPHKYDSKMFQTGILSSVFSDSQQIRIDANIWCKNGITVENDNRDDPDSWKIWGETDSILTINGNVICENTDWVEDQPYRSWPDGLMIKRFQPWYEILDMMKKSNNVMINLFPQPDQYRIIRSE
jgi:Tfp pilus assembly protein PilX